MAQPTPPTPGRRPRNAWLEDDPELDRAAEQAGRLASPRTPRREPTAGPSDRLRAAGLSDPGDPPPARAIVSTAAGYTIGEPPTGRLIRPAKNENWSKECWAFYDAVGELHYVAGQFARAVSRGRLYIAKYDEDGVAKEVKTGDAAAIGRDMLGGEAHASDVLFTSAAQQFMTGQSLLTAHDDDGWEAFSDNDFTVDQATMRYANRGTSNSLYKVDIGTGAQEPLPAGTLTIHMWNRHPGRAYMVDCSVRPALPYLRELARLDQYVQSLLLSRIALSGILKLPPGTEVVVPPELRQVVGDAGGDGNGLMHVLAAIGMQNISNPGTAAAVLPVLLQMAHPDHTLEHITLDQPLTAEINAFREINLRRVSYSLDMAPETMSGFSDVKYSNAEWITGESTQTHIVRQLNAFASALTRFYAVPLLDDTHTVKVDISELELDQDRTDSAIALYDRGELDGDGLRIKSKMADTAAPEGRELLRQLMVRAVTTNPSLLPQLAPYLGLGEAITVTPQESQALEDAGPGDSGLSPKPIPDAAPTAVPDNAPPNPTPVRPPQPLPATAVVSDALVAACDVVVCSALASAGSRWRKRVRARAAQCRGTEPQAVYLTHPLCADRPANETAAEHAAALVADRWPQVPRIAALHAADPGCLQASLSGYVAGLIADQRPHHPATLTDVVACCVDGGCP